MSISADNAKGALAHYLRTLYEAAGLQWTGENRSEVDAIVDDIVEASVEELHIKLGDKA